MTGRRVTGVAILVYIALALTHARTPSAQPQPPTATSDAGFVGAAACASCHKEVHDTWKGARHSKMLQAATAASVKGDFSKASVTLHGERFPLRATDGEYFITSSVTGKAAGTPRRVHARQPPHPALPDDDRQGDDRRPAADLGRAAPRVAAQHGHRPAGRKPPAAGAAVEQGLRRLPRQRAGQQLPSGDRRVRDDVA